MHVRSIGGFLTHETDTCPYWEDYDYNMYGDVPQRDGGGA